MATQETEDGTGEAQADVDACLRETGVTSDQINRWRRQGLLPPVVQAQNAYRGSTVRYPIGTCAQIRAAQKLFLEKDRREYVGLRLWRMGFPVSDQYWRPRLERFARIADRGLWSIQRLNSLLNRNWQNATLPDIAANHPTNNVILSRPRGRLSVGDQAIVARVLMEIGAGRFIGFEAPVKGETQTRDELATIAALDIGASQQRSIRGHSLNLVEALSMALINLSLAHSNGTYAEAAAAPIEEIQIARNDAINALRIGVSLYDSTRWIYGDHALGLRFWRWIAAKASDAAIDGLILGVLRLRRIPGSLLPSDTIAALAREAENACKASLEIKRLGENDPRFKTLFTAARFRAAFKDEIAFKRFQIDIENARNSGSN